MSEMYVDEELADMAIPHLSSFLHEESKFVQAEHDLHLKLDSAGYVVAHLMERIPENLTHLHALNDKIYDGLLEITDLVTSGRLHELKIVEEEDRIKARLASDVNHKNWRAVRLNIDLETKKEKEVIRLEEHELKNLHSKFHNFMNLMKESSLNSVLNEDQINPKDKKDYVKLEEYYFVQIHKFLKTYEQIFRHLLEKEILLSKTLRGDSKKFR